MQMKRPTLANNKSCVLIANLILAAFYCPSTVAEPALLLTGYSISSEAAQSPAAAEASGDAALRQTLAQLGIAGESPEYAETVRLIDHYFQSTELALPVNQTQPYAQLYLSCMLSIATATGGWSIRLPKDSASIVLERWDHRTREADSLVLQGNPAADRQADTSSPAVTGLQASGEQETLLGYAAVAYRKPAAASDAAAVPASNSEPDLQEDANVSANSDVLPQSSHNRIAVPVHVKQGYTAWMAKNVKGGEIAQSFFSRLKGQLPPEQEQQLIYQGVLRRQVELLQYGLPLHVLEWQKSQIGDTVLSTQTTESWANSLQVLELDSDSCTTSPIPPDFQVTRSGH